MIVVQVGFSSVDVGLAQIIFRDEINRSDFKSMTENCEAVFPVGGLPPGESCEKNQEESGYAGENFGALQEPQRILSDPPDDQHKNSNERDVGIAVGHSLAADLHESDHRHQAAEIPQPSREQIALLKMAQAEIRKGHKKQNRQ